jgi:hypothetical protein
MNTPFNSAQIKKLPKGFTVTGEYPNRRMRRYSNPSGGNRVNNNARHTQLIQGNVLQENGSLSFGKRIVHNYLAIKLMLARMLPVWGRSKA